MSLSHTYFEELHEQSKDLVEILAYTQEERVLYALCVVYQQLAFAEQDPPFEAKALLQEHAERLEQYVRSKDIDSMLYQLVESDVANPEFLYDIHELAFVLDFLNIEEEYLVSMVNIQKVIQSFPEIYASLCPRAEKMLSISKHPTRFFDDVLRTIMDTAHATTDETILLNDDEIASIFAQVEEEEDSDVGIVIHVDFGGEHRIFHLEANVRLAAGTANTDTQKQYEKVFLENDQLLLVLMRRNSEIAMYLIPKGDSIEKPIVKHNGGSISVRRFSTGWSWDFDVGTYSIMIEGVECRLDIQDES